MTTSQDFLQLIKKSRRGKFKIYIGMSAGVGKTYRMLQEAHALLESGIDVKIGYVETHNRKETKALIEGLSEKFVPKIFPKMNKRLIIIKWIFKQIQSTRNYSLNT